MIYSPFTKFRESNCKCLVLIRRFVFTLSALYNIDFVIINIKIEDRSQICILKSDLIVSQGKKKIFLLLQRVIF
jgi:hypothetical protein